MKCRRCNKSIPENSKFCQHCGRAQQFSFSKFIARFLVFVCIVAGLFAFKYRVDVYRYFKNYQTEPLTASSESEKNDYVFENYSNNVFGLDVSQYQGNIQWSKLKELKSGVPIHFVFVRATMGDDGTDKKFRRNWRNAKKQAYLRGAYHYYRPNENSYKQADNFINRVTLNKGDLVPVLDIEEISTKQSMDNLRLGLKRWLTRVEDHYGVKPIIYTADRFYDSYLSNGEFDSYTIWIANFNKVKKPSTKHWKIWQFSEKGKVAGINHPVDFNVYKGSVLDFEELIIK